MALQDILTAITQEADAQLEAARKEHQKVLTTMREESEQRTAKRKQEIATTKEAKKDQMIAKTQSHAEMVKRNTALNKKRELLDRLYDQVVDALAAMPADKVSSLLETCLKQLPSKGTLRPAAKQADLLKKLLPSGMELGETVDAKGGFVFVSAKQEQDFTFEHIVASQLRPKTEVDIAHKLFGS